MKIHEYTKLTLTQRSFVDKLQTVESLLVTNGNEKGIVRRLANMGFVEYELVHLTKEQETATSNFGYRVKLT